jgi:hypothetical protein
MSFFMTNREIMESVIFLDPLCTIIRRENIVWILAAAIRELAGLKGVMLITLATDGEDGPTDAASAVVTGDSLRLASKYPRAGRSGSGCRSG